MPGDERRGGDDVDPRLEDANKFVDVDPHRVIDDDVGLQGEQRVDVIGGLDAQRRDAGEFADVAAGLVLRPGVTANQFECGIGGDSRY